VSAELRNIDDLAVRYGGEELLVLLPRTEALTAARIAERIRRSVEALAIPHEAIGLRGIVTLSCGAAAAPVSTITAPELIAAADTALYAAKRNGRNQVWPQLLYHKRCCRRAIACQGYLVAALASVARTDRVRGISFNRANGPASDQANRPGYFAASI
jgi:predicted signal transduction protein with EAL and GGDEF domain